MNALLVSSYVRSRGNELQRAFIGKQTMQVRFQKLFLCKDSFHSRIVIVSIVFNRSIEPC
jgi:hypothetical protein